MWSTLVHPAWPADDLIASELVAQAREWQQKSRDDLAADIWRKLLRTNPQHPEALVKLGVIQARAGQRKDAEALYSRAAQLTTPPMGLDQLSAALGVDDNTSKDMVSPQHKPMSAQNKSLRLKPDVPKLLPAKPTAPVAQTPLEKLDVPMKKAPDLAVPMKSAQPTAKAAPSKARPAQTLEIDSLHLTFSTSLGMSR